MKLDLERLQYVHPLLPVSTAAERVQCAAIALQRRHAPGVAAGIKLPAESHQAVLFWNERPVAEAQQLDHQRTTEDGAEGVALSLVHAARGWVVVRRLQRGEHADWLLRETTTRRLIALEVSGTDEGDGHARMAVKLAQVAESRAARTRAACVVGFLEPQAALEFVLETPQ